MQAAYLQLQAAQAAVAAAQLHLTRMLVEHERPHRRKAPGTQTKGWLERAARLGRGAASTEVAAARATDPACGALRGLGAALAAGEVSRQHVEVATRLLPRLPQRVLDERREEVDDHLTDQARDFSPSDTDTLTKHLRRAVCSDDPADQWPEPPAASYERRQGSWYTDWTGMVQFRFSVPEADALPLTAALSGLAAPTRCASPDSGDQDDDDGDPGGAEAPVDVRTTTQRNADAFAELVRRGESAPGDLEAEVGRLVVVATEAQLAEDPGAGGAVCTHDPDPLSTTALRRHACDAVVDKVVLDRHGAVVRMESLGRLATRAQRRALAARDGGCAFPQCSAPATWCEAHHIVFWSQGGATDVANLVLLCSRHHTEIHLGHWTITVRAAVPWFVPPPWVDAAQRPLRNSFHQRIAATRAAAADLRRQPGGQPGGQPGARPDHQEDADAEAA
nr:HNH endonuclease signature motif containing protein [Quadrisphaera sp. RL12-1S]